jgi:hypothetical protein
MKEQVRNRAGVGIPKKEYRRRGDAPLISIGMILILLFGFAVMKGEQWGFLGSERLSGFFANKSNFDVEIRYDGGMTISTFTDSLTSEDGERKELVFTKQETQEIFTKVESLNLKKEKYLSHEESCYTQPNQSYVMKIRMNRDTHVYRYSDCNTTADARELDELRELIIQIINRKSGYRDLLKQKLIM